MPSLAFPMSTLASPQATLQLGAVRHYHCSFTPPHYWDRMRN
ncbi:MAG: hypothetical protein ACTSRK_11990 [Promethearchaeota archaeon]